MSLFKNFAWSGAAVVLAAVLSLGLMAQTAHAAVTITTTLTFAAQASPTEAELNDGTALAGTMSTATGTYVGSATNLVLTETAAGQIGNGTLIINVPSGWQLQDTGTCTVAAAVEVTCVPTLNAAGTVLTWTIAGGASAAARTLTSGSLELRPRSNTAAAGNFVLDAASTAIGGVSGLSAGQSVGSVVAMTAYAADAAPYSINLSMTNGTTPCGTTNPVTTVAATTAADGSGALALCAAVRAASGNPIVGAPVTFTVSTGVVSTGTSKTVVAISNSAGNASTNYRGGGNVAGSDTAIASNTQLNAVGTLAITLTAATGTTSSKVVLVAPSVLALGQTIALTTPNYQAPTASIGTFMAAQVQDASGLGVNAQTILVTTDKGFVVASPAFGVTIATACGANGQGGTAVSKSITLTTVGTDKLTSGGANTPGAADFILCPVTSTVVDAPGKATITVQNISTAMANATSSVTIANRPAKVTAVASGNAITATVVDAAGNVVADGTPIRFTMSSNAGAVSVACTTSTNGVASSVVALIAATGTVIVSSDWSETVGVQATCAAAGAQQIAASVTVPGGTSTGGTTTTPPAPGAGSVSSGSIPAAGGFGLIVASGNITAVVTATGCPAASMALWATVNGNFVTYVPGTTITAVNADFLAAFPGGILPAGTPLIGKCK